ncbi:MAG: hypothetical protein ACI4VK_05900 [Candidatus Coproplasma sp.]
MINLLKSFWELEWYYYVLMFVGVCIVFGILGVIKDAIVKKISGGAGDSTATDSKSVSVDSGEDSGEATGTVDPDEPFFVDTKYYRWQSDKQIVIERTPEQQRIFDEYFVIKNYVYKKKPLLVIGLIALLAGLAAVIAGLFTKPIVWIIGAAVAVFGIILLIAYSKSKKIKPGTIMTDAEYENLVVEHINKMNVGMMGLHKLGLAVDQVKAIKPVFLRDKVITKTSLKVFNPEDCSMHSSTQYVIVLYFTEEQLFVYKVQFDMCCNMQDEWTKEFFYKDICDFSSVDEYNILTVGSNKYEYNTLTFSIISTNSRIDFTIDGKNPNVNSVQEMKKKIREKKRL